MCDHGRNEEALKEETSYERIAALPRFPRVMSCSICIMTIM
jgi:hypothetical protein